MHKTSIHERNGTIVLLDSITKIAAEDRGTYVVSASHGGKSCGDYALKFPLKAVVFNDAGVGKNNAGIASLAMMEEAGIIAATASHTSARIGEVTDMWLNGVISYVNRQAAEAGLAPGMPLQGAILQLVR